MLFILKATKKHQDILIVIKKYLPKRLKTSIFVRRLAIKFFNTPIKVWYWRSEIINFGDELTPDIIWFLFKKETIRVEVEEADLVAVGSIIEVVNRPRAKKMFVWGAGFIESGEPINNPKLIFCAVRGYLTRDRLPSRNKNIAVGDPGLLSSLVYEKSSSKSDKIGIIPHFVDEDDRLLKKAKKRPDLYRIISVKSSPQDVVRQITECRMILSSSLHGLIVADSFGIPNMHMPLSDKVHGGEYKFRDYYSSINRNYISFKKGNLYNTEKIVEAANGYKRIDNLAEIQNRLIESFPFK